MTKDRIVGQLSPPVQEGEEIPILPLEIMVEILSRLPVKSIFRFRCVSKPWLSLISDPILAKSHFKKTIRNDFFYYRRKRVLISRYNLYSLEYESIGKDGSCDENVVALELDYPLKDEPTKYLPLVEDNDEFSAMMNRELNLSADDRNWVQIFGSCNGLVCISPYAHTIYLFNPSTRESKKVPDSSAGSSINGYCVFGFGFDDVNDDYKLVRVGCAAVSVYSLRTDSWKMVSRLPYYDNLRESGLLLNGAIHWMTCYGHGAEYKSVVAAFSLEKESFLELPAPDIVHDSFEFMLGVLNGCLCVLHNSHPMRNEFWVMTKYGIGESWTKLTLNLWFRRMEPLCLVQSGEALLKVDGKLLLYNLENDSYRYLVADAIAGEEHFEAATYLETIVSPNGFCRT